MNRRTSRIVAVVAVAVLLAASTPALASTSNGFGGLFSQISDLWSGLDLWKSLGTMDPDGTPNDPDDGTNGSLGTMDPDGVHGTNGSLGTMDPDGVPDGSGG